MPSHYPSLNSYQESYQLIGNKNKAGVLLGIGFFSYEAEEPLLCLVVSAVGYPEETVVNSCTLLITVSQPGLSLVHLWSGY